MIAAVVVAVVVIAAVAVAETLQVDRRRDGDQAPHLVFVMERKELQVLWEERQPKLRRTNV